jgi:type I restriction enzyme S subunit
MINKVRLDQLCTPKSSNLAQKDILENHGEYPVYGASAFIKKVDFCHRENEYIAVVKDGAGIGRTS